LKHVDGPDVSFREGSIALGRRDGDDPRRTYFGRFGWVCRHHEPFDNGFRRSGRFLANKTLDFQPNRAFVVAMIVPHAGKILRIVPGDDESRAIREAIFGETKCNPFVEAYDLLYVVQKTDKFLARVGHKSASPAMDITARNSTRC